MEYDSILKEEKVYKDPEVHHSKYTKYVIFYIFSLIILLGISYIIYYQKVLSPSNIFFNDMNMVLGDYGKIMSYAIPNHMDTNKNLAGTVVINDVQYDYGILREEDGLYLEVSDFDNYLFYQEMDQESYLEVSNLIGKNIHLEEMISFQRISSFKEILKEYLTDEHYIKRFYFEGMNPIVEVNLVLKTNDLEQILGVHISDDYEFTFTLKNHAVMNEIVDCKLVVRNQTKDTRVVYRYEDKKITYTDNNGEKYQFALILDQEDFYLKIYRDDVLYSIFLGKKLEKTYQYTYQIIDQVYNVSLSFVEENGEYRYEISSNIEKDGVEKKQSMIIIMSSYQDTLLEERNSKILEYSNLSEEDQLKYQEFLNTFFLPIREFINEY